jgi:peptidoglycan hydrolase-like protein with peptidoglycan-binding domain
VVTLRDAQERLNAMGINVGTPDGKAGPRTRAGLRKFQKDHGLYQSGTLDQPTKNALNQPQ